MQFRVSIRLYKVPRRHNLFIKNALLCIQREWPKEIAVEKNKTASLLSILTSHGRLKKFSKITSMALTLWTDQYPSAATSRTHPQHALKRFIRTTSSARKEIRCVSLSEKLNKSRNMILSVRSSPRQTSRIRIDLHHRNPQPSVNVASNGSNIGIIKLKYKSTNSRSNMNKNTHSSQLLLLKLILCIKRPTTANWTVKLLRNTYKNRTWPVPSRLMPNKERKKSFRKEKSGPLMWQSHRCQTSQPSIEKHHARV